MTPFIVGFILVIPGFILVIPANSSFQRFILDLCLLGDDILPGVPLALSSPRRQRSIVGAGFPPSRE
ncbi:hypothetical protein [Endozoicomonas sp. ALB060]|uniref:hypothetical protein n=1 Tax=Endozoicomonas sp. ALB060 TaxID=3403072 RepID=UPI003BB4C194